MTAPLPLVPSNTDVRDLDGFMLNVERLLASELIAVATPEECWAALMLWCRAWKQVPGGSLPNDERILASFSGAGKRWPKVRENAMRGFVLCSDGRYYHKFLCIEVMKANAKKQAFQVKRETDRRRLSEWREKRHRNDDGNDDENASETCFVAEGQGQGQVVSIPVADATGGAPPSDDPVKAMFDRGAAIFGPKGRSLIGKARKDHGDFAVLRAIKACETEAPSEPAGFFIACLTRGPPAEISERYPNEGVFR